MQANWQLSSQKNESFFAHIMWLEQVADEVGGGLYPNKSLSYKLVKSLAGELICNSKIIRRLVCRWLNN